MSDFNSRLASELFDSRNTPRSTYNSTDGMNNANHLQYLFRNQKGQLECQLCGTIHHTEDEFLVHTTYSVHKVRLRKFLNRLNHIKNNEIEIDPVEDKSSVIPQKCQKSVDNRPEFSIFRRRSKKDNILKYVFECELPKLNEHEVPRYKVIRRDERNKPDFKYLYVHVYAPRYDPIVFKIPKFFFKKERDVLADYDPVNKILTVEVFINFENSPEDGFDESSAAAHVDPSVEIPEPQDISLSKIIGEPQNTKAFFLSSPPDMDSAPPEYVPPTFKPSPTFKPPVLQSVSEEIKFVPPKPVEEEVLVYTPAYENERPSSPFNEIKEPVPSHNREGARSPSPAMPPSPTQSSPPQTKYMIQTRTLESRVIESTQLSPPPFEKMETKKESRKENKRESKRENKTSDDNKYSQGQIINTTTRGKITKYYDLSGETVDPDSSEEERRYNKYETYNDEGRRRKSEIGLRRRRNSGRLEPREVVYRTRRYTEHGPLEHYGYVRVRRNRYYSPERRIRKERHYSTAHYQRDYRRESHREPYRDRLSYSVPRDQYRPKDQYILRDPYQSRDKYTLRDTYHSRDKYTFRDPYQSREKYTYRDPYHDHDDYRRSRLSRSLRVTRNAGTVFPPLNWKDREDPYKETDREFSNYYYRDDHYLVSPPSREDSYNSFKHQRSKSRSRLRNM